MPITTIEDVIGGRYHRHVEAETITVYKITKPSTRALIDREACLHETIGTLRSGTRRLLERGG